MNCNYDSPIQCNNPWRIWCDGINGCGNKGYIDVDIQIQCPKKSSNYEKGT